MRDILKEIDEKLDEIEAKENVRIGQRLIEYS